MKPFVLPPERYNELPFKLDTNNSIVVAVEDPDSKRVRSFMCAQNIVHIEPTYFDEADRDKLTGIKIFALMLAALSSHGVTNYLACCDDPVVGSYLERLGLALMPFITYAGQVPPLPKEQECLSSQPQSLPQSLEAVPQ